MYFRDSLDFILDRNNYYQQKYPKKQELDKTWYLEEFRDFMFNSPDSIFLADADKWIEYDGLSRGTKALGTYQTLDGNPRIQLSGDAQGKVVSA